MTCIHTDLPEHLWGGDAEGCRGRRQWGRPLELAHGADATQGAAGFSGTAVLF